MNENCKHERYKKNFPFGKNSKPIIKCKDCGKVITLKYLETKR